MNRYRPHLAIGLMVFAVVLVAVSEIRQPDTPTASIDTIISVVDGDTVELASGSTVRLIGIDTPEQGECGYVEATEHLTRLIGNSKVELVSGARNDQDRYGRLLRYIDVGDVDAGLAQIQAGLARTRYDSRDGYGSHPRENQYIEAEAAAGLPVCVPGIPPSDIPGVISSGYSNDGAVCE